MKKNSFFNLSKEPKSDKLTSAIIVVILYICVIKYLKDLQECNCTSEVSNNIQTLLYIQYFILFIIIIETSIFIYMISKSGQRGGGDMLDLYMIIFIIIYAGLIYNAFKIYKIIDKKCECTMSGLRFLFYGQIGLVIISMLVMLFNYKNMKYGIKSFYK